MPAGALLSLMQVACGLLGVVCLRFICVELNAANSLSASC